MGKVIAILAVASNDVIGKDNDLPWQLPTDMKHFKNTTNGHTVVMGRKCYESIPEKYRPLPNRRNVILTRNEDYIQEGAEIVHSLDDALALSSEGDVFIAGGAEIYKQVLDFADELIITRIKEEVEGDIYFDWYNKMGWELKSESDIIKENGFTYTIQTYE